MVNYTVAHEVALEKFRACSLKDMARCSGYSIEDNKLSLNFLGAHYYVDYPSGKFLAGSASAAGNELPVPTQILILHYLANLTETVETGKLISFKELPGGSIYIQPFTHRAIDPLVRYFGANPDRLLKVAAGLGGQANQHGDVGVTFRIFPRIPVTLILWRADDEFPASGNILFDSSAPLILPTEDYAVLAGVIVFGFKRISAEG